MKSASDSDADGQLGRILDLCIPLRSHCQSTVLIGSAAHHLYTVGFSRRPWNVDLYMAREDFRALDAFLEPVEPLRGRAWSSALSVEVYAEGNSRLSISHRDVFARSSVVCDIRVACLDDLIEMKRAAVARRYGTGKWPTDKWDLRELQRLAAR